MYTSSFTESLATRGAGLKIVFKTRDSLESCLILAQSSFLIDRFVGEGIFNTLLQVSSMEIGRLEVPVDNFERPDW